TLEFWRVDFRLFKELTQNVPWDTDLKNKGAQEGWTCFKKEILKAQEQAVPMCRNKSCRDSQPAWMGNELLKELRGKKRVCHLWKKGEVTHRMFKDVARSYRKKIREAKAHLELRLASAVKDNKKSFHKYTNSKRRGKSLVDTDGNVVAKDEEKAEVLNTFFALTFNGKTDCLPDNWPPELANGDREQYSSPVIQEEVV
ncbi:hypothetical protein N307_09347, partial [Dryobates pubescens]